LKSTSEYPGLLTYRNPASDQVYQGDLYYINEALIVTPTGSP